MNLQITRISVEIRLNNKRSALKGFADVRIHTAEGILHERGYAIIIHKEGEPPYVAFPSRPGNTPGKFFPTVDAEGDIRKEIVDAILAAYRNIGKP